MLLREIAIQAVNLVHLAVLVIQLVGGVVLPDRYVPLYMWLFPALVFEWNDYDGHCTLTVLGDWLRGSTHVPFTRRVARQLLGFNPSDAQLTQFGYMSASLNFAAAYYRYRRLPHRLPMFPPKEPWLRYAVVGYLALWVFVYLFHARVSA